MSGSRDISKMFTVEGYRQKDFQCSGVCCTEKQFAVVLYKEGVQKDKASLHFGGGTVRHKG